MIMNDFRPLTENVGMNISYLKNCKIKTKKMKI